MLNPELALNARPIDRLSRNSRLDALAERIQPIVAGLLAAAPAPVQNLLHGSVLGHPLHAIMTDVPVGAWTVTAILDGLELCGAPVAGSDAALVIGLAGAGGAIVTGLADWSDTAGAPRTLGLAHALVNDVAVGAYVTALILRRNGRRRLGLWLALGAYAVVSTGAYLGGELAYGQLLGAKHTAEPIVPPAEFTPVLGVDDLADEKPVRADLEGIPILVTRADGGIAAISAVCTHRGAPLDEGEFADGCVRCPWHGSTFALDDGRVVQGPATFPQPRFEARINGDRVEVRALQL